MKRLALRGYSLFSIQIYFVSLHKTTRTDENDTNLLQKTHAGVIVEDEAHLQEVFKELVAEFKEKGKIACYSVGVENYSRKIQVKKLAGILMVNG